MQQKKGVKINSIEQILQIGTAAGGARPKIVIAKDNTTNEFYAGDVLNKNKEVTYYLLKLDGTTDNQNSETSQYGKIEFAYYQLATLSGINMSKTELLVENDRNHFLTQRFDRIDGKKIHSQTLNSIANLDYNNPLINSYEQCFSVMRKLNLSQSEIEQQFKRMVFNVMSKNLDDHTKNISFLMNDIGKWSLSPAYDLTHSYDPNNKWLKQHQMSINGKRNNIEYNDLIEVAEKQMIGNTNFIIQEVQEGVSNWIKIAKNLDIPLEKTNKIEQSLEYNSIKPSLIKPNKINEISSDEKIKKSIDFHLNNNYNLKINNLILFGEEGALNKALKQNFGFVLNIKELKQVYEKVKIENKNLKKGRKF
jgi:serine/threonine-protein kinase HipA